MRSHGVSLFLSFVALAWEGDLAFTVINFAVRRSFVSPHKLQATIENFNIYNASSHSPEEDRYQDHVAHENFNFNSDLLEAAHEHFRQYDGAGHSPEEIYYRREHQPTQENFDEYNAASYSTRGESPQHEASYKHSNDRRTARYRYPPADLYQQQQAVQENFNFNNEASDSQEDEYPQHQAPREFFTDDSTSSYRYSFEDEHLNEDDTVSSSFEDEVHHQQQPALENVYQDIEPNYSFEVNLDQQHFEVKLHQPALENVNQNIEASYSFEDKEHQSNLQAAHENINQDIEASYSFEDIKHQQNHQAALGDVNEDNEASYPPEETLLLQAYEEWRIKFGRGGFDPIRYEYFKYNYRALMSFNASALFRARFKGRPEPLPMELNEYGDYSIEEFKDVPDDDISPEVNLYLM